jgi:hypothetical protein
MNLYKVTYKIWNAYAFETIRRERLSIGANEEEAIERIKANESISARDFEAEEITEVFGHKIEVK